MALAGNAVENVVGIQFAARNQSDFAISVILNSSLQVAIGLIPVLVLLSFLKGGTHLTLVMALLLVALLVFKDRGVGSAARQAQVERYNRVPPTR